MFETTFLNNQPYMPLTAIASALCLKRELVEDLVMEKDFKGTVEIIDNNVMVPFDVFKKLKLPQDEYFFKIAAAYLKGRIRKKKGD